VGCVLTDFMPKSHTARSGTVAKHAPYMIPMRNCSGNGVDRRFGAALHVRHDLKPDRRYTRDPPEIRRKKSLMYAASNEPQVSAGSALSGTVESTNTAGSSAASQGGTSQA